MPADEPPYVPSLIEVGTRVFNAIYLVVSDRVGEPMRKDLVDVTMASGTVYRLEGDDATWWLLALSRLVAPENRQVVPRVNRVEHAKVRRKKNRTAEKGGV